MKKFLIFVFCVLLFSCDESSSESSDLEGSESNETSFSLEFDSVENGTLDTIQVDIIVSGSASPSTDDFEISASKGVVSDTSKVSSSKFRFTVTPSESGEFPITVSYDGAGISRTPLVFPNANSSWGQPLEVPGYPSTEGYEDGVTVTSDCEYVFVQTGPHYFSGVFIMDVARPDGAGGAFKRLDPDRFEHHFIDETVGPFSAPERPGFFTGRINTADGTLKHNALSYNVGENLTPNYAMATMFYGFHLQSDGTYKDPFYLAFEDETDALVNPFGLSFHKLSNGQWRVLYSLKMPNEADQPALDYNNDTVNDGSVSDNQFDVYTMDISLGENVTLGEFNKDSGGATVGPRKNNSNFPSTLVNFGDIGTDGIYGTQGNSDYNEISGVPFIFTDDEFDSGSPQGDDKGDISVYVLESGSFPNGTWSKTVLPSKINTGSDEIQPYFDGDGLFYVDISNGFIYYSAYSGNFTASDFSNNANWGTPEAIITKDSSSNLGNLITVGEPTTCKNSEGEEYLFFVYGYNREILSPVNDIDLNPGYVKKR